MSTRLQTSAQVAPAEDLGSLIEGCKRQDRESQRLLYSLYYGFALKIVYRYAGDYSAAIRLTNEAMVEVFRSFSGFRAPEDMALEYAFGLDPWVNDKPVFSFGFAGGSGGVLRANYQRIRLASDLTFAWSGSTNLVDWTAAAVSESVATDTNPRFEDVTANFGPQHPGAQFYRLGVTLGN